MNITLMINLSDPNVLDKILASDNLPINFVFKGPSSLYDPTIIIQTEEDITRFNYAYIAEWGRYYYINPDNVNVVAQNRYEMILECDSLSTFSEQLKNETCIIDRTENYGGSPYLQSEAYVANCKHKTDIIPFSSGLSDSGEFILITAGG